MNFKIGSFIIEKKILSTSLSKRERRDWNRILLKLLFDKIYDKETKALNLEKYRILAGVKNHNLYSIKKLQIQQGYSSCCHND